MGIPTPHDRADPSIPPSPQSSGHKHDPRRPGTAISEAVSKVEQVVEEAADENVVIPGDSEQIAQETSEVSPEGRPGDPKAGPKALRLEVLVGFLLVVCFAVALGIWVNVFAGVAAFVLGTLGLLFNPVVGATSQRAIEREQVVDTHHHEKPNTVVIRTTSKRKERRFTRSE